MSIKPGATLYAQRLDFETRSGEGTLKPLLAEGSANLRMELAELARLELKLRAQDAKLEFQLRIMAAKGLIQPPPVQTQKERAKEAAEKFFVSFEHSLPDKPNAGDRQNGEEQGLMRGVEINAQTVNICGDVVGRDKTGDDISSMPQESSAR